VARLESERAIEQILGGGQIAAAERDLAQQAVGGGTVRIEAHREGEVELRLGGAVEREQSARAAHAQRRPVAVVDQGAAGHRQDGAVVAGLEELLGGAQDLGQLVSRRLHAGSGAPKNRGQFLGAGAWRAVSRVGFGSMAFVRCALLILLAACLLARPASAQEGSGADRRRQASYHVKKGDAFKEAGDYAAAAREYKNAYELVPHPVLFFNLAQVYRLDGDRKRALEYYERYLAMEPDGQASKQARQFADQLRDELASEREGDGDPGARSDSGRDAEGDSGAATGAGAGSDGGTPAGSVSRRVSEPVKAGRGLRVAGLISGGAGLVAIGLGFKFGLDASRITDEINGHDAGEWPDALLARQAEGERAERNMFILTGAGAAAIAAGGVLYYLGHRARRDATERTVGVRPVAGGGQVGVVLAGSF
jgi:tetratricopeptide (TPR) repeat protein